ncbi:unnamed protein product [Dibothriocephalus latus]|uniref:Uncharacterized protein n=1 Tax=Dibothriocephalus latus TaxID=60516 RepID=A0A3P6U3U1_DIBLA|nr:unnamed protein product [Dibothriocephalus latus]
MSKSTFLQKETAPIKRGESPFTNPLPEKDYLAPWRSCRASMLSTSSDSNDSPLNQRGPSASSPSPTSSTSSSPQRSLLGRGSNLPKRMGSLVIFRVHASITDDVQSLVEFIAALLSDQEAPDSAFKPSGGKLSSPSSLSSTTQGRRSHFVWDRFTLFYFACTAYPYTVLLFLPCDNYQHL